MDSVSLQDLSVRLGAPYVYCHGYGCEHVVSFTDLRVEKMIDTSGGAPPYPRETFRRPQERKKCDFCATTWRATKAQYVVYDHPMAGKNPTYFCEPCYKSFNYDENDKLLVEKFKTYAYFHEL